MAQEIDACLTLCCWFARCATAAIGRPCRKGGPGESATVSRARPSSFLGRMSAVGLTSYPGLDRATSPLAPPPSLVVSTLFIAPHGSSPRDAQSICTTCAHNCILCSSPVCLNCMNTCSKCSDVFCDSCDKILVRCEVSLPGEDTRGPWCPVGQW